MNIEATLFAWNHGIPTLESVGNWNGYEVFTPTHTVAKEGGESNVILASRHEVRFASQSEINRCLDALAS